MNLIQRQADDFLMFKHDEYGNSKEFVSDVKSELWEYNKTPHKVEFIERIILKLKIGFDKHLETCSKDCGVKKYYENTLFFLQEELELHEEDLEEKEFLRPEKDNLNETLEKILQDLNSLKFGQEITYNDFASEFEELKDMYFLDKKNWSQLFMGKLTEMIASGVVSETMSKEIAGLIKSNYTNLF
jgi:hypothetical protein